jgi:hypothetical protein
LKKEAKVAIFDFGGIHHHASNTPPLLGGIIDGDEFDPNMWLSKPMVSKIEHAKKVLTQALSIPIDLHPIDLNGDGIITAADCPYTPGTVKARLWWDYVLVPYTKAHITKSMKAQYGNRVVGSYNDKPLVPGEPGRGQGDFDFMVDRLRVTRGLSEGSARGQKKTVWLRGRKRRSNVPHHNSHEYC